MNAEISRAVRAARKPLREQRDAWKLAAVGLLVLSIIGNVFLYGASIQSAKKNEAEIDALQVELKHVSAVRDQALQELGELSVRTAQEKLARQEQAEAYEAVGAYRYIGECTVTAYCTCAECCGRWADGLTATGIPAGPGIVAVDPEVIPLGSTVVLDGQRYLAADTGVTEYRVDLCMASHDQAAAFGTQTAEVWVAAE